jgi:hypothetical protein
MLSLGIEFFDPGFNSKAIAFPALKAIHINDFQEIHRFQENIFAPGTGIIRNM